MITKEQVINLIDNSKSDIGWRVSHYPDGQVHLELLDEINRKDNLRIICKIRNSDELFLLAQLGNILEQIQVLPNILDIKYLLAARTDRVFDLGKQALDLKIVANIVNSLNADIVRITDVHSDMATRLIKNSISYQYDWWMASDHNIISDHPVIIFPDEGAYKRNDDRMYNDGSILVRLSENFYHILYGEKVRGADGSVKSLELKACPESKCINSYEAGRYNYYVIDDLSDGGGTFIKLAENFTKNKKKGVDYKSLNLIVTHMIQDTGLLRLCEIYDNVYTTNSYIDRYASNYPSNLVIENVVK